jgi:hypothetical protein
MHGLEAPIDPELEIFDIFLSAIVAASGQLFLTWTIIDSEKLVDKLVPL